MRQSRVATPLPRASLGRRTVCGRTEQRRPPGSKRYKTKVRMVWGSFLIAAAVLKTPTRTGYNAQGVNFTFLTPMELLPDVNSSSQAPDTASGQKINRSHAHAHGSRTNHSHEHRASNGATTLNSEPLTRPLICFCRPSIPRMGLPLRACRTS